MEGRVQLPVPLDQLIDLISVDPVEYKPEDCVANDFELWITYVTSVYWPREYPI